MTAADVPRAQQLAGRRALVTGAGRGIGAACALQLARAGAQVIAVARTAADLDALRENSAAIECWSMDICDSAFLARVESLETLDVLVNNVGTNRPEPFYEVSQDNLDAVLHLNVRTAFLVAQAAARVMRRSGRGGSIIHMSSQMGHVGAPLRTVYCMTKHAIEGLSKAMAVELAADGIRVNTVAPTFIDTPMTRPMLSDPAFRQDVLERIPLGRLGSVDEVAAATLFLASPAASMITGDSLKVDGGWTAR